MQCCWLTLLLYLHIKIIKNNEFVTKDHVKIGFVEVLSMLTHYYALFYILPLFVVTLIIFKEDRIYRRKYLISNIVSGLIYICLWPQFIFHVFLTDRGQEVRENMTSINVFDQLVGYVNCLSHSIFGGSIIFLCGFCLCVLYFLIKQITVSGKSEVCSWLLSTKGKYFIIIVVPALFYFFVVAKVSPWLSSRYETPIIPILSIMVLLCLDVMTENIKYKKKMGVLFIYTVLTQSLWMFGKTHLEHLYQTTSEKKSFLNHYSNYNAITISVNNVPTHVEIIANIKHPQYINTDEFHAENLLKSNLTDDGYVLYVNKYCENYSIDLLRKLNYSLNKIDYGDMDYDIYFLTKNQ